MSTRSGRLSFTMPTIRDIHTSSDSRWMPPSAIRISWERTLTASSSCLPIRFIHASRLLMAVWMPSVLPKKSMLSSSLRRRASRQRVSASRHGRLKVSRNWNQPDSQNLLLRIMMRNRMVLTQRMKVKTLIQMLAKASNR